MALYLPEEASARARMRLAKSGTVDALWRAGTQFLVYDPELSDADVLLLYFPCSWDDEAPKVAAMCTCGLSETVQTGRRQWCFEAFELVVAFYSPGFSKALLHQMLLLTRDVREWIAGADPKAFGFGDSIAHFPLIAGRSSALLIPPVPELVQAGLRPYRASPSTFDIRDWINPDVLVLGGNIGFLQAVPLYDSEYAHVARTGDGLRFMLDYLLPTGAEFAAGKGSAFRILDMDRPPVT